MPVLVQPVARVRTEPPDRLPTETKQLRRMVRDLVAFSALPSIWIGYDVQHIADSLAEVLLESLQLDAVLLSISHAGRLLDVVRLTQDMRSKDYTESYRAALTPWLQAENPDAAASMPNPAGGGRVRLALQPIGYPQEAGMVVAASSRADFPTENDRLLLSVGANQAAALLQHKRAEDQLREQREILDTLNRELDQRVSERTAELRALAGHLHTAREEERATIARELHDELGQILTIAKMDLSHLVKRMTANMYADPLPAAKVADAVRAVVISIDETIQSTRRIMQQLRPAALDELGLKATLEWQVQQFQERTGTQCAFSANIDSIALDHRRSIAMYRIFQESLTNIARHAQASSVQVRLSSNGAELLLEIQDNGRGIRAEEKAKSGHFGLLGMNERAILLGGMIEIRGVPDRGTLVSVRVPLAQSAEGGEGT